MRIHRVTHTPHTAHPARAPRAAHASAPRAVAARAVHVRMYMGKWAKDGQMHALTTPADFTVKAGHPVTLVITNVDDDMGHSFTAPGLGIDEKLPPAHDGKPTTRTVTFTATTPGRFEWHCTVACGMKSMATDGMMRGTITVEK